MGARVAGGSGGSIAVSASTTVVSVARSMNIPITYTLSRTNYTDTVTPAVTGLPSGVTGAWSDTSLSGAETTTVLTLSASGGAGLVTDDPFVVTFSGSGVADVTINSTVTVTESVTWTAGPGANAPTWIGKTTYATQQFATPLPVGPNPATAEGFRGDQGFPNYGGQTWLPTRVTYPSISTPLGTQPVLQILYPGQTESIAANGQSTTVWQYAGTEYTNVGVRVTGTWTGTLSFETSADNITWVAITGYNGSTFVNESSTTVNGSWQVNNSSSTRAAYQYFRVRATSAMTGSASVSVGVSGGQSPARALFGTMPSNPSRVYFRMGFRTSADWSDNGNSGTKFVFFSQTVRTNNYVNMTNGTTNLVSPGVNLQFYGSPPSQSIPATVEFAHGEWHDLEVILEANVPGVANGVVKTWIDGVQALNRNDVLLFPSATTAQFSNWYLDPTYGGGLRPATNYTVQLAQFYYESAP